MSRAKPYLALAALLVLPLGLLAPGTASALVQRVVLVEEVGFLT